MGARFPAIPLCSSLHVAPRLVSGTNMMQKRRWKAAYEMRLWDTAASGRVIFLLSLGLLTQGKRKSQLPMWWVALWRGLLVGTWGLQPAGDAETPGKRSDDGAWLPSWWWPLGDLEPELPVEARLDSQRLLVSGTKNKLLIYWHYRIRISHHSWNSVNRYIGSQVYIIVDFLFVVIKHPHH